MGRPALVDIPKSSGSTKLVAKATMEKRKLANVPYRIASSAILCSLVVDSKFADILVIASLVSIATKVCLMAIFCPESTSC